MAGYSSVMAVVLSEDIMIVPLNHLVMLKIHMSLECAKTLTMHGRFYGCLRVVPRYNCNAGSQWKD